MEGYDQFMDILVESPIFFVNTRSIGFDVNMAAWETKTRRTTGVLLNLNLQGKIDRNIY